MNAHEILGVDSNATEADIRYAYYQLVAEHHPDRGGDVDTFRRICEAYEQIGRRREVSLSLASIHQSDLGGFHERVAETEPGLAFRFVRSVLFVAIPCGLLVMSLRWLPMTMSTTIGAAPTHTRQPGESKIPAAVGVRSIQGLDRINLAGRYTSAKLGRRVRHVLDENGTYHRLSVDLARPYEERGAWEVIDGVIQYQLIAFRVGDGVWETYDAPHQQQLNLSRLTSSGDLFFTTGVSWRRETLHSSTARDFPQVVEWDVP